MTLGPIPSPPCRDLRELVLRSGSRASGFRFGIGTAACDSPSFADRVLRLASGLLQAGMQPGDRIAVLLPRGLEEAVVLCAAACAGGIAVPIHGKLKDDQVAHILADAEPFAVVTSGLRLLSMRDPASLLADRRCFASADAALPVAATSLSEIEAARRGPASAVEPEALPAIDPDAAAVILYTSGSTGLPKGIVQSHRNLALGAALVADYLGLQSGDRLLAVLPFSFDYGLNQLLSALHVGCSIVAADPLGAGELHDLLRSVRPTGLAGVPSLWRQVAASLGTGTLTAEDGGCLRYVTNSGGTLQEADGRALRRHWPHVQVFAMYGLTEAFRSAYLPPAEFDAHPTSFGRALPGVELLLVEPSRGTVVDGPGQGELVHAGALVSLGYWRRPDATAAKFRPDPRGGEGTVVYSGDLVRRDAEGRLYFVSRLDRLLKVHGHRLSPDEVVAAVQGMDGVGEAAALGVPGGADGHRVVLFVQGDPLDGALVAGVLRRCRQRLPSYAQPGEVVVLTEFPHNANGKIDEGALRAKMA